MQTLPITYPPELPVSQRRAEIAEAIRDHQVVVVAGETGSGKTTQLPKICLELGRGTNGMIGHTQPRRLAARTVAERVASELRTPLGETVGYQVRFTDRVSRTTQIKLMTDGILLAELARDRSLRRYDTIILDEAHERSLNVDFLLGYLARLLPRRPDLKLIITSATIDPERFSRHFGGAPVVEVSGRTYPVEVRYRPLGADADADDDRDQTHGILDAVDELCREGPGDILVFLSGEREIRDTAEALRGHQFPRSPGGVEVLPLYARLAAAEQHRVFQAHAGRRVVLATNVAETSLTVPGIKYVVDPGTARISRYSHRSKVQRLPIEPISQASANQRKGRCGRTSEGICIRLYSEDDFNARPEFTEPEILRTNLASVILQMTSLRLGDVARFPFIDPPDRRSVKAGVDLLAELGALDGGRLTPVGRKLAQIPADPRLARMLLEAGRLGCAREVLVIVAALSIQDPRERPADKQERADELHRRFADKGSDFLTWLNLWRHLHELQAELSSSQFRRRCRAEFLNYLRVREWQDLHGQLRAVARDLGIKLNRPEPEPDADQVHTALLAGLLSHIGLKQGDTREYLGARGTRFALWPGSALARKPPTWVMAAELVETTRLWGREAARIEPEWAEALAGHLVRRSYAEPHWSRSRGAVMATERVTLYGVPIVTDRQVNYARVDPDAARELFIRHALVEGDWETSHEFLARNRRLLAEVEELEHRARRRDILVDDHTLFDFYDRRIPDEVVSARHFDAWWKRASQDRPDLLDFERSMLIEEAADAPDVEDYPDTWHQDGLRLRLTYQFEPGSDADGVTVHIPLAVLNQVVPDGFDWQVPGLRHELVTELIRSLPKAIRRDFIPAPNWATSALSRIGPADGPLLEALGRELERAGPVEVPPDAFNLTRVPDHLRMTFRVVDRPAGRPAGRRPAQVVGEGKDLEQLKERLAPRMRAAIAAAAPGLERDQVTTWDLGTLPRVVEERRAGRVVRGFPALVAEDGRVAVRLLETEDEQAAAMWAGTRSLLLDEIPSPVRFVLGRQTNQAKLTLSRYRHGSATDLFADCLAAAADDLIAANGGPAWDEAGFRRLRDAVRGELAGATLDVVSRVERVLAAAGDVERRLAELTNPAFAPATADVRAQLDALIYPGWVTATGRRRLPDVLRYVRAMVQRLDRLPGDLAADADRMESMARVTDAWRRAADRPPATRPDPAALAEIRWMLEELRVSYFAQSLGTAYPVSEKRALRAIDRLTG
ncbi:MAG TPA: ATP-dependent RNA helicase HrpA [Actinomycetes bacterium]|nr:ATP-dependent RNA helicase HrpA [Actinomycetes bacterium]